MKWRIYGQIMQEWGRNLQIEHRTSLKDALLVRRTCSTPCFAAPFALFCISICKFLRGSFGRLSAELR